MDLSRGKGVQFPFAVSDRVIIKVNTKMLKDCLLCCIIFILLTFKKIIQGNKRTPQRFVGRVAVVTAQCLNGWLVTLDHESLYYGSRCQSTWLI